MRKLWKTLLVLVILAGASAAVYALSRNSKKTDGTKEVEVTTGSIVEKAVAVGQIQPRQKFQVKSKPLMKSPDSSDVMARVTMGSRKKSSSQPPPGRISK